MIALDTNVLVYAHRAEFPQHAQAVRVLRELSEGVIPFGVPVFALGEFLRVCTHRTYLRPPSSDGEATDFLEGVLASPSCRVLHTGPVFWRLLREDVLQHRVRGNDVFDAQLAAVCRQHGVQAVVTQDRAFARSTGLRTIGLDDL